MLLLELILNDGAVKDSLKAVQKLEFTQNCIIVIKALGDDWGKSSLEFLYLSSEHKEVLVKLFLVDIHSIIREGSEILNSFFKLFWDLFDGLSQGLSFGSSQLNPLELIELHDGGR